MGDHLQTAWTHIRRSPYKALAAVGIMTLSFFATSLFVLVAAGSQKILAYFEARPQVTAFFEDEVTREQVDSLKARLAETGKVKEAVYISQERALEIYREQNKDDPLLLEMVTANILPASLEVSTTDISYLGEIAQILEDEPGVEEVIFQEDVVQSLGQWTRSLRLIGLVLVGFLAGVSLLIVLVIIGLKVALRREEIKILQLIGASPWYIRAPFVAEGIFYGMGGVFVGWGLGWLALLYSTPFLVEFLAGIPLFPVPVWFMFELLAVEAMGGILIGVLGSLLAVKRYLR